MKSRSRIVLLLPAVLAFVFTWSCKKSTSNSSHPVTPPVVEYINATVNGRVVDGSGLPVAGALVSTVFTSTSTDINGHFVLSNAKLDKNAGFISAQKAGYFTGSRTLILAAASSAYTQITLITKTKTVTFDAGAGGIVSVNNGATINFSAGSITDPATGAAYSGIVTVYAFYLDPSSPVFGDIMPGALRGIQTDSSEKVLQSYGVVVAELDGSNGQKLQIAAGKTAIITFPVPASLQSSASATIPLWYFDEVKGLWREQGSAALQGGNYIASVSHFSFWNCDAPYPVVNFHALIDDKTGSPLSGVKVAIRNSGDSTVLFSAAYTDAAGNIGGRIPASNNLQILVYNRCGALIYSQNFTTTAADIDLGTINADAQAVPVNFSGTITNCSGAPVTNGTLSIVLDGFYTIVSITDGNFALTINRCYATPGNAVVTAVDLSDNLVDAKTFVVTNADISGISLKPCDKSDEYIKYSIKSVADSFLFPPDSLVDGYSVAGYQIKSFKKPSGNSFTMYFSDTTRLNTPINANINIPKYGDYGGTSVTLINFGPVGSYVTGSFTANLSDSLNGFVLVPVVGTFNIMRTH